MCAAKADFFGRLFSTSAKLQPSALRAEPKILCENPTILHPTSAHYGAVSVKLNPTIYGYQASHSLGLIQSAPKPEPWTSCLSVAVVSPCPPAPMTTNRCGKILGYSRTCYQLGAQEDAQLPAAQVHDMHGFTAPCPPPNRSL